MIKKKRGKKLDASQVPGTGGKFATVIAGMTQRDAAAALGVSLATINYIIHGHRLPSLLVAARIERLFGISAGDWIVDDGNA